VQKTICDGCGRECVNYTARFYGNIHHATAQGEDLGEDIISGREFCGDCAGPLIEAFGFKVTRRFDGETIRDAIEAPARVTGRGHP
jgi:hypothetical protein